jgi:hypothetical protein
MVGMEHEPQSRSYNNNAFNRTCLVRSRPVPSGSKSISYYPPPKDKGRYGKLYKLVSVGVERRHVFHLIQLASEIF